MIAIIERVVLILLGAFATVCILGIGATLFSKAAHQPIGNIKENTVYTLPTTGVGGIVRLTNQGRTYCTGSVVNNTTVITAAHCVATDSPIGIIINTGPIEVRSDDNRPHNTFGKVRSLSMQLDQAVLHGNFAIYNKLDLIDDVATLQRHRNHEEPLLACGYALGGKLYCNKVTYHDLNNFMWSVDGVLLPGMSGGPVLTPDGSIIGINDAVSGNKSIISPTYNIRGGF